jgi:hypothetical protein
MADAEIDMIDDQAAANKPRASAVNAEPHSAPPRPSTGKASTFSLHLAAAATIDELLANEARASLKRSREIAREGAVKSISRPFVPPARIVARPLHSQSWKTPFMVLALAVVGSTFLCAGGMAYLFARPFAVAVASDAELRSLRESVALLRRNVTELSESVTVNRTALDTANKLNGDRFARVGRTPDRAERESSPAVARSEGAAENSAPIARPAPADITGSIQKTPKASSLPRELIAGWRVRRAYDGVAILEGKSGVIEVALGQDVPDIGRIQEIRLENNRWMVLTSRGVIQQSR